MRLLSLFSFYFLIIAFSFSNISAQSAALNVELFGQFNRGDERYSGSWAYVAPDGSEYALIGAKTGMAVYSIDNSNDIQELGFIPGPATNWREITVLGQYAYVVTDVQDSGHSMQVVDLSNLPDGISLVTSYNATFEKGHIIQRDIYSDAPYVYVHGTDSSQGTHIVDVTDPANPVEVGLYAPGYYIHDGHVKGDFLYAAAFYEDKIDVVDISDKTNPTLITSIPDPGNNTHSSWITEDNKYLFVADEQDGVEATIFNIEDLDDPTPVARYLSNPASLVHNPYIKGDFAFCSHNTEGLTIVDIADPTLPVEVGYYDTFLGESGGFSGLWSACPYFPSGKIIGGDRTEGLMIWTFNDTRAGRFYGVVKDIETGVILPDAIIEMNISEDLPLDSNAEFRHGALAGDFTLEVSHPLYNPKTVEFTLMEGDSLFFEIELLNYFLGAANDLSLGVLKTYPNPFYSFTTLELPETISRGNVVLKNTFGQRIQTFTFENEEYLKIDGTVLASGFYLLEIWSDGELVGMSKLIKK